MSGLHSLSIDLETYSEAPIQKTGAWRYVDDPSFEILLFAYSVDFAPVKVVDLAQGEEVPQEILRALHSPEYIKCAYNAHFEYASLSKYYGPLEPSQWRCTMFHGLYAGYTAGLDATGKALGLPQEKQKLATGKALIRYFCIPCKPTKANGGRTRNLPRHDLEKWELFKEYCIRDVETEQEIAKRLSAFPVPEWVQKQWVTDLRINQRGVAVDMAMCRGALAIGARSKDELVREAIEITGLQNPNSVSQLSEWLAKADDNIAVDNLRKDTVADLLNGYLGSEDIRRVLEIRQELGKTSTKKYDAIEACVCADGRVRGLLQFYGANRTGRWAGRLVQVQNLPRTYTDPIPLAKKLITEENKAGLQLIYGSVPDTLSQMIRTAFISTPENILVDADFSAIEARVVSWLAGEKWKIKAFEDGEDIYCSTASRMFGVPVSKHGANKHLRQRGKVAELACGYGGGVGAMRRMDVGHQLDDSTDDEVQELVTVWRQANPEIVRLWSICDGMAKKTVKTGQTTKYERDGKTFLTARREWLGATPILTIELPSSRKLFYINPAMTTNRFGSESMSYMGVDQQTKQWKALETYGGKIVENITQAIARDCLAHAIENLESANFPIVFHVHDEVVIDMPHNNNDKELLNEVVRIMSQPPEWAEGMPLTADGWTDYYFKKD